MYIYIYWHSARLQGILKRRGCVEKREHVTRKSGSANCVSQCNVLQQAEKHCNTLQHTATLWLQLVLKSSQSTCCNTLQLVPEPSRGVVKPQVGWTTALLVCDKKSFKVHRTCMSGPIQICMTLLCHICVPYLFCIRVPRLIHTCVPWKLILIFFVITCSATKTIFSQSLLPDGPISSPAPVFYTTPSACEQPAPDCGELFLCLPSECMRLEKRKKEGVLISRLSQWLVCCVWERVVVCDSMLRVSDTLCVVESCVFITQRCECQWVLVCYSMFCAGDFRQDPNKKKKSRS